MVILRCIPDLHCFPPQSSWFPTISALDCIGKYVLGRRLLHDHPIIALVDSCKHPGEVVKLHAHAIVSGLIQDTFAASRIVSLYINSESGDLRQCRRVFDSINSRDVYTWNLIIRAHVEQSSPESAVQLYFEMVGDSLSPNTYTFALLVKGCILSRRIDLGELVHGQILKNGAENVTIVQNSLMQMYCTVDRVEDAYRLFMDCPCTDVISWNTLIGGYSRIGEVERAHQLFEKMPEKNLISWSAMIDGYVKNGRFMEGLDLFREMQFMGVRPDRVTLASVLCACANLGALDQGKWVHNYIQKSRMGFNLILGTALVDMYAKCGWIDTAYELFNEMREKDVVLWNAMIGGLAIHGHGRKALELFTRMRSSSVTPNEMTFMNILCACNHAGLVDEGKKYFDCMQNKYAIEPRIEHYGCLADMLGRAGCLEEAEEVIRDMPMKAQASHWGALMAACRTHNNTEVGERVGKHLIELEPEDGGRYIVLSNAYAAAGRWKDAYDVRRLMQERGVRKDPGCSFVEWNGAIHEFIAGDKEHPDTIAIYKMLDYVELKLKDAGYVPDTSQVLIDIDDEERELVLSHHSEKLAVAFGMIRIAPNIPIRVVKNLRICRDCHSVIKFISKVFDRKIIVRDKNRFHTFENGSCSCMGYW
ncbi:pentatricopeptide repeat-containing protein At5g66520-like [Nymphaea colorata]|uniref:DYW domain-containing protein n=1 Tax=Nymphaea colorata TaxID=210225 RepID=A0A5K0ZGB4_9MAGN|nr:pentatricopeptide repeat-containing protein At5g66520-like [Nymphaea colorata]